MPATSRVLGRERISRAGRGVHYYKNSILLGAASVTQFGSGGDGRNYADLKFGPSGVVLGKVGRCFVSSLKRQLVNFHDRVVDLFMRSSMSP